MVCLEALVVVWVIVLDFRCVVAACTLTSFAAARPILDVGKVGLLLLGLLVGVQLAFVRVGELESGALIRMLVELVGLDGGATLESLLPLSSITFVAISASALGIVAFFVGVVAKHVRVPCFHSHLDLSAALDIMRAEAFGASVEHPTDVRFCSSSLECAGRILECRCRASLGSYGGRANCQPDARHPFLG